MTLLILTACGGGGGGSSPEPEELSGVFLDSPVWNIGYTLNNSDQLDYTTSEGRFNYRRGDRITFRIGSIKLPSTLAKETITPLDLGQTSDPTKPVVLNILQLLQSLDVDGNAENGIEISNLAHEYATNLDINFNLSSLRKNVGLMGLLENSGSVLTDLLPLDQCLDHFDQTVNTDGDDLRNYLDPDDDNDGVNDEFDAFPFDPNESADSNLDGIGDDESADNDGDLRLDQIDNCPNHANPSQLDTDHDGIGDACDPDQDGDGLSTSEEDARGTNPLLTDTDADTIKDNLDNCPVIANANQKDTDHDGIGDVCDNDTDNDGVADSSDNCPLFSNADQEDIDLDGIGNVCDSDNDNDLVFDTIDNCVEVANTDQRDSDHDGIGDACEIDDDRDGLNDGIDNCPSIANADQANLDGDALGDVCDSDIDGDGLSNSQEDNLGTNPRQVDTDADETHDNVDNCALVANADQLDTDEDDLGDACDSDQDNDGLSNAAETSLGTDALLKDTDGDETNDDVDNCPILANADQLDTNHDGQGNVCDDDDDGDSVVDPDDNCPLAANQDQTDIDHDGEGDVCDPNDGSPTATNDSYSVLGGSVNNVLTILGNDVPGPDGYREPAFELLTLPGHGTVVVNNNGTADNSADDFLNYTPDSDFVGADAFTYEIVDINGDKSQAMVELEIAFLLTNLAVSAGEQPRTLKFTWDAPEGVDHFVLLLKPDASSGFQPYDGGVVTYTGNQALVEVSVHLLDWDNAVFMLEARDSAENVLASDEVALAGSGLSGQVIGLFKASNPRASYYFGTASSSREVENTGNKALALSADGSVMIVGSPGEYGTASGIDGSQTYDVDFGGSGAVYIYVKDTQGGWSQKHYVKASNAGKGDAFGHAVALSADGTTIAVSAQYEASSATGVDGNQADNSHLGAGAVYIFTRTELGVWQQQAYIKASNTDTQDRFGYAIALSADGNTLAIGAPQEDSIVTGINGIESDNSRANLGSAYIYIRNGENLWSKQAYIKPDVSYSNYYFGTQLSLSDDGNRLAIAAALDDSGANGVGGNPNQTGIDGESDSGAVYLFSRDEASQWSRNVYIKASNPDFQDRFGSALDLSGDGKVLAVGAPREDSSTTGIDGEQSLNDAENAGAVYVFKLNELGEWSQTAYIKASDTHVRHLSNTSVSNDNFGWSVALSTDGGLLAVGALNEDGIATGVNGDQTSTLVGQDRGAAYVFAVDESGQYQQTRYLKTRAYPSYVSGYTYEFGYGIALSADGKTLAIGSKDPYMAAGINGSSTQKGNYTGAVFLY